MTNVNVIKVLAITDDIYTKISHVSPVNFGICGSMLIFPSTICSLKADLLHYKEGFNVMT